MTNLQFSGLEMTDDESSAFGTVGYAMDDGATKGECALSRISRPEGQQAGSTN